MLYAPASTEDLVARYERMLERYLDVPLALAVLQPEQAADPRDRLLLDVVVAAE